MTKKLLTETHPHLCKEWHPTKNNELKPENFTVGSHKRIWWQCSKYLDHVWEAQIKNRVNGRGCPFCVGKKVCQSNCLATTHPELCKEWDYHKNGVITPFNVTFGNDSKKVWWICFKNNTHNWQAKINNRAVLGRGCPFCTNRKINEENNFAVLFPELLKEWDFDKNTQINPYEIFGGSPKKVWWVCQKNNCHKWQTTVNARAYSAKNNCPYCPHFCIKKVDLSNCLATTHPNIVQNYWDFDKNKGITPEVVTFGSKVEVHWKCKKAYDHEWIAPICQKTNKKSPGCPYCTGHRVAFSTCLLSTHPEIVNNYWDFDKNVKSPEMFSRGSNEKIHWKCKNGHKWIASIGNLTNKNNPTRCPYCKPSKGENMIMSILEKHKIPYKREFRFKSCKYKQQLPFDFLIHDHFILNSIKLIEFQGAQHYQPFSFRKTKKPEEEIENLKQIQKRDKIKRDWCAKNKIPLLEIPYWIERQNIEDLILQFYYNQTPSK